MPQPKLPVLVAETAAIRKMIATALQQQGFAPAGCEPKDADTELLKRRYRILITSSPAHLRRHQIPTIYLAADTLELLEDLPAHIRVIAKPFGVDQLIELVRKLMMLHPAAHRKPDAPAQITAIGRFRAGG